MYEWDWIRVHNSECYLQYVNENEQDLEYTNQSEWYLQYKNESEHLNNIVTGAFLIIRQ